jgi:hypothetical protein
MIRYIMEHTLETLNKDLYPWFFRHLEVCDVIAFAHATRYAYSAFLKYLRTWYSTDGICLFDLYRFSNFSKQVYLRDLIDIVCHDNTKSRLLHGMAQQMTHDTQVTAFWAAIKMRAPANVKVMLKWIDPGYGNNEPLRHACVHNHPEIVKVLLEDPRTRPYSRVLIQLNGCTWREEIMHMLLRDARFYTVDLTYAMELAIKYDDNVAFKAMFETNDNSKNITPYMFMFAIMWNRVKMIKLMVPRMDTESINRRLRWDKMTEKVRSILTAELIKRAAV